MVNPAPGFDLPRCLRGGSLPGSGPGRVGGRCVPRLGPRFRRPPGDPGWVPEGSLAGFLGVRFFGLAGPWGPRKPCKMWGAKPPTFWKAFPGPRGRPDFKNAPPKNQARLPSGAQRQVA